MPRPYNRRHQQDLGEVYRPKKPAKASRKPEYSTSKGGK